MRFSFGNRNCILVELKENLRIRIHDLKPVDLTHSDFSNEFSDNHGDTQLTESRIDCLSCILGQDAPDEDYQLPEDAKFCRHFLPEYWQTKGFDRGWGDAAVMNWPHLEILVRLPLWKKPHRLPSGYCAERENLS